MPEVFEGEWYNESGIECPHCGAVDTDDLGDVSAGAHDCAFCGEAMELEIEYSVTYTTSKPKAAT